MEVKIVIDPDTGKYVLDDPNQGEFLFQAIIDSFPEEELVKLKRCPMCNKKTVFKMLSYEVNRHMIDVLFEMRRVILSDPEQHGFVYMREETRGIREGQQLFSMTNGAQQNHKMCYLGLITQIDRNGNPVSPGQPGALQSAYKITDKGMALMKGQKISPWRIHRKLGRTIVTKEDGESSGTIFDAKQMSYEDYVSMCVSANIEHLMVPDAIGATYAEQGI